MPGDGRLVAAADSFRAVRYAFLKAAELAAVFARLGEMASGAIGANVCLGRGHG